MEQNKDYDDFSAPDAPDHLLQALKQYFQQKRYQFNISLAKKHLDQLLERNNYADATTIFKIITGTDLVTNKHILQYRTTQGMQYLIKKGFAQSAQRDICQQRRADFGPKITDNRSPFLKLMNKTPIDDSSDEESVKPIHQTPNTSVTKKDKPTEKTPEPTPQTIEYETYSIGSDVVKEAEDLQKGLDSALADLQDKDSTESPNTDNLTSVVQTVMSQEMQGILNRFDEKEKNLMEATDECNKLAKLLKTKLDQVDKVYSDFSEMNDTMIIRVNFLNRSLDEYESRINKLSYDEATLVKNISTTVQNTMDTRIDGIQHNLQSKHDEFNDSIVIQNVVSNHEKLQRRMKRLKDGTKQMFQQTDADYELLTDRVHTLESTIRQLQNRPNNRTKLNFDDEDNSDSSSLLPKKVPSKRTPVTPNSFTQHSYPIPNYYRGPNIDYLRKNVNITCKNQDQILEFYIKLRLAIEKGGIYILPIEEITKSKSIAQQTEIFSKEDLQTQSNALFTLLSNENFIPKEFTMAQNCILGYAANMDGFGALKAMLKLTHPLLSRKRPSNIPPVMSDSTDIHSYEQSLRNYYLLHKLYNEIEYPPIEKAKQFLQGIDDDRYSDAVTRVQHQLDTAETLDIPLHEDYDIDNIASTIINISSEYDNLKTVVNTMKHNNYNQDLQQQDRRFPHRKQDHHRNFNQRRSQPRKFSKTQCYVCKSFRHGINHCSLLPKILAILQFQKKNGDKCEKILKQHVANNTVNAKRTFIRTLMNMEVLPPGEDSDAYLSDDIIVNIAVNNNINEADCDSQSE